MYYAYQILKINLKLFYEENLTLKNEYIECINKINNYYLPLIRNLKPDINEKIECIIPRNLLNQYSNIDYFKILR